MTIAPRRMLAAGLALAVSAAGAASAKEPIYPVIKGYGGVTQSPDAAHRPDPKLDYKALFNITRAAPKEGAPNNSLSKVARFLNLLGEDGIRPAPGNVVPIVHADATPMVLSAAAFAKRFPGRTNPDAELIGLLKAAGAQVHVCAQALAGKGYDPSEVSADVIVDDSALLTLSNLQFRGWALIPD